MIFSRRFFAECAADDIGHDLVEVAYACHLNLEIFLGVLQINFGEPFLDNFILNFFLNLIRNVLNSF